MYFSKFYTVFTFCIALTLICLHQVTVINLSKFFIVQILNKEIQHFLVLNFKSLFYNLCFRLLFLYWSIIYQIDFFHLLWNEFAIPRDEEVITIKIRTTYLSSYRELSFFRKDNTIYKLTKNIFFSPSLKSDASLSLRNALHFSDICRMKTWISCNDDFSLDVLFFDIESQIIKHSTIYFSLFKNVILVDYLNKIQFTPIILAESLIIMLLLILS